jgi:hypothetical protein
LVDGFDEHQEACRAQTARQRTFRAIALWTPMTHDDIAAIALALPGTTESAHFGKRDFRGPKVFMSLPAETTANLNLKPDQQLMLSGLYPGELTALPNKWGQRGWTTLHLDRCNETTAKMAVEMAWRNVAPKKLLAQMP